ncbi:hypothetical protein JTB14_033833 [Gonioctena quinquepunctata]|nr:hypothetical protein JTB14_033833 [Gonioctena quinquepunctata]
MTLHYFCLNIIGELLWSQNFMPNVKNEQHIVTKCGKSEKGNTLRRKCKVCAAHGKRRETTYEFTSADVRKRNWDFFHQCDICFKLYKYSHSLSRHRKYECGKQPSFECFVLGCNYKSKRKDNLNAHVKTLHMKEMNIT